MIPDLSQPRMVSLEEVSQLFKRAPSTIKKAVQHGKFPIPPRISGPRTPMQWSSVDLLKYFADPKAKYVAGAKRGTSKPGAK